MHKGSVTHRFCPRETSYGRSSGDPPFPPPRALETPHTVFDSADAPEALFILQTLKLSVVYKSTLLFRRMCCLAETRYFIKALSTIATGNPYPPNCRQGHLDLIIDIQLGHIK
jgi:hypothetical protein